MKFRSTFLVLLTASAACAGPFGSPSTAGDVFISAGGDTYAYFVGSTAGYSNDLHLYSPFVSGILFNNHAATAGDSVFVGNFTPGTELIFGIFVNDTGETWKNGPGSRNPDGLVHARVSGWAADGLIPVDGVYVEFEDLDGLPEGAAGYNDLAFVFASVAATPSVPEPGTISIAAIALLAGFALRRPLSRGRS